MKILPSTTTQAAPSMQPAKQAKLVQAAQQFEAMLLQQILKPMRSGQDSWGGDGGGSLDSSGNSDSSDGSMDTISSFGTEAVAAAISKGGGFGIAKQIIRQVSLEHQRDTERETAGY